MVTHDDVRRIASTLPGAEEGEDGFGFGVPVRGKTKGFCWTWNERIVPKRPKVPNPGVLAIVVPNLLEKDILMESDPDRYVVDPHYNKYPAVLVRLDAVSVGEIEELLIGAWRCKAPPALQKQYDGG